MQIISVNCPACNGFYGGAFTSRFITCEYCGSRFTLSKDELTALGFEDADGDGYDDNDRPNKFKAAIPTYAGPLYQYARDQCSEFLDKAKSNQSKFRSTSKVLQGLGITSDDDVYLIHDDTLLGSGKNGFAITESGIYCRELSDASAHFVSWDDFKDAERPELDGNYVRQDDVSICYFTDNKRLRNKLCDMFQRLWDYAQTQ